MQNITRPRAIVLEKICRRNITAMAEKAKNMNAEFRPHFKTHQSTEIGRWFRDAGITGITVSTPEMAEYFIDDGWNDITIGFPFFRAQIDVLKRLSERCHFKLFVHDPQDVEALRKSFSNPLSVIIEIDAGYGRSGIAADDLDKIQDVILKTKDSEVVRFHGFYIHDGDTYKVKGKEEVEKIIKRSLQAFQNLKEYFPDAALCLGDTPSGSLLSNLVGLDELSPGNLIFYDLMQINIGSCSFNDIGLLIQVPVAQEKPNSDECIIHGGAVHFSKDRISMDGSISFGQPVVLSKEGFIRKIDNTSLIALSQEHGTIKGLNSLKNAYGVKNLKEVWICPVHSCLTANLFREYHTPSGTVIRKKVLS